RTRLTREAYANRRSRTKWEPSRTSVGAAPAWYVQAALSRWRARSSGAVAAAAALVVLAGCGAAARQDASEPTGNFTVDVPLATFPTAQRLAEHTHMVITVRNASSKTIPNIAVTITSPKNGGTAAQAFGHLIAPAPGLASRSRPIWVI